MKPIAGLACSLLACVALSQQPNTAGAGMTVNGADGPPFPIATEVRTSLPATFSISGSPDQPYAVFLAAAIQVGTATAFGDSVDLDLTSFPTLLVDGFQDAAHTTDGSGLGAFTVIVPPTIPVGTQVALQAIVGDPSSPFGLSLTAATLVTVTQGPSITTLPFSDGGPGGGTSTVQVNLPFPVPFYGQNRTQAMVSLDGYVAFSPLTATDLPPSVASLNAGAPRCAVFWTDLVLGQGSVTSIVDATPGSGVPAYWEVQYSNVQSAVDGQSYDFAFKIDVTGLITMTFWHPFGVPSSSELQATGIAAGFSISFAGIKDLSSCSLFPYSGSVMESIAEAFGYASNPSWPYLVDRPFDLAGSSSGSELYFWPSGAGPLPGSSNRYVAFRLDL